MPALRDYAFKPLSTAGIIYWLVRSVFRFFVTGRAISGKPRDNSTLLRAATKDYRDRPIENLSGPIWHRLARRWAVLGVPLVLVWIGVVAGLVQSVDRTAPAWTTWPWLPMASLWWFVMTVAILGWLMVEAVRIIRGRKTINEFVYPTWQAACTSLGVVYHRRDARRMVKLPPGFEPSDTVDEPVQHGLLARWTGVAKIQDRIVLRRLARERADQEAQAELELASTADVSPPEPALEPSGTALAVRAPSAMSGWKLYVDKLRPSRTPVTSEIVEPPVRLFLPPGKCGPVRTQQALLLAVGGVLGMPDPKASWMLRGRHPYVELRPNRKPPEAVTFEQVRRAFAESDLDHPVVGVSAGGRAVRIDYLNNSPHVLVSGGSGTGKSVLIKAIEAQRMHCGAGLAVLDYKRVSHRWAHNLPGCVYAWRIEELHRVAVLIGQELERRIENVLPDGDDTEMELVSFRTLDILVEEINSLTPQLQAYWAETRRPTDPMPSPAVAAIRRVVNMGREYSMHVVVGAQRASATVFGAGGGDVRESFATRIMAKWTMQTWKMLAGGMPYQRFPGGGRGVWAVIEDDMAEIVRTPFLTNEQARTWATSGEPSPGTPLGGDLTTPGPVTIVDTAPTVPELVTLKDALELLPGPPMTYDALRKAAQRPGFPQPATQGPGGRTWDLGVLQSWKLDLDGRKGLEDGWSLPEAKRAGRVYRAMVTNPDTGAVVVGYVGQTVRRLEIREAEHLADKPWADLVVGRFEEIWFSEACTQTELDAMEQYYIHGLRPMFNYEHQEGAEHAIPLPQQVRDRQFRQTVAGLPAWEPVDIYNRGR